jgi:hypothetical protein
VNIESQDFLQTPTYSPIRGSSLADSVLRTLVGTSRTFRMGPMPSDSTLSTLSENISTKITLNEPLEITSAWGACKTLPGYDHSVDLAEIMTLNQYDAINKTIKQIYEPGINYNIVLSDSFYDYLYGANPGSVEYCNDMERLISNYPQMACYRTSTIHNLSSNEIIIECDDNYNALKSYWNESESKPEEEWSSLGTYKDLTEIGWVGTIPKVMRDFYLKRMQGLYPEGNQQQHTDKVIKFFAYGLVLKQYNAFKRNMPNECTADFCLLRVPPPGMPKELHGNRLRVRSNSPKISNQSSPPWTIEGALKLQKDGLLKPIFISDASLARNSLHSAIYDSWLNINLYYE